MRGAPHDRRGALAAYGSPRLEATQSGNTITIDVAQSAGDDATALIRIISPIGRQILERQPAGTAIGAARDLRDHGLRRRAGRCRGRLAVVRPEPIAPAELRGCAVGEGAEGLWSLNLTGAVTPSIPVYLIVGGDLLLCLPHPRSLTQGAKLNVNPTLKGLSVQSGTVRKR